MTFREFLSANTGGGFSGLSETRVKSLGRKIIPDNRKELFRIVSRSDTYLGDVVIPKHITDLSKLFEYSERKDFSGIETWDVSHVKDMSWMFDNAYYFNSDISEWNVSNVTNMRGMFYNCQHFNQPIGKWDVSKVTDMEYMFESCRMFNRPLDKWNVSKVTNMKRMFCGCWHFNQPLKKWNLRSVKDVSAMFLEAHNFDQDLSSWEEKYNIKPEDIYDRERLEKLGL